MIEYFISSLPHKPSSILFWTGAGISMDAPSSMPSGYDLTKEVVESFLLPDTWEILTSFLTKASYNDPSGKRKTFPRLEAVMGSIVSVLGSNFLTRFASMNPDPNQNHQFFAKHITHGGTHITMNLDEGIENAFSERYGNSIIPSILHLHGKFCDPPTQLGLTFERLSQGLSDDLSKKIIEALRNARAIIFAGYSGSDYFDIDPFFLNIAGQEDFTGKKVLWLDHKGYGNVVIPYPTSDMKSSIMDSLNNCNAETYVYRGPTNLAIEELRRFWGFYPETPLVATGRVPAFDRSIADWQRCLITARVYVAMGMGNKALITLKSMGNITSQYEQYCSGNTELEELIPGNRIVYQLNEAHREMGLYRDASAISRRFKGVGKLDQMLIHERKASEAWLGGAWWRARRLFLRALAFGKPYLGTSYRFDVLYVETLRAYMQLCRDICRLPTLGKYLSGWLFIYPIKLIATDTHLQQLLTSDVYDRVHIARIFRWDGKHLQRFKSMLPFFLLDESSAVQVFGETDNILGIINTIRSRYHAAMVQGVPPSRFAMFRLVMLSKSIDDNPGVVKACHLLLKMGYVSKKSFWMYMNALRNTQWVTTRKTTDLLIFIGGVGISELVRYISLIFSWFRK